MKLYTYLPKENTALSEGLLYTVLSDNGFEKYRGRTGKYSKEDVLKVLDSWEPEWTRSKAISALTEPIPEDAAEDFLEFARNRRLYSFDTKDLIKAKILAHIRRARKGGGTDPVDEPSKERPNWHRKKKHLLFQGVPHYFVETTGGKVPPELVTEEKKAEAHHPDIDAVLKAYKDRFGVDLSHVKFKWSRHPRYYDSGEVSREIPDDETGGSHGKGGIVWINPNLRPVMNKFNVPGKVKDFRRLMLAHELAHEIDDAGSKAHNPELVKRLLAEAKKNNFRTAYTDTYDPKKMPRKFDKELFAEYVANLLTHPAEKKAEMSRDRIQAQYARHPQSSLDILAARLAKRKWGPEDVVREYDAHSREYDETKEDKEFLDRYIIARIGEKYDRKARIKQALMRRLWEKEHNGESFDAALPYRMARFRQYESVPFPVSEKKAASPLSRNALHEMKRIMDIPSADSNPTQEQLDSIWDVDLSKIPGQTTPYHLLASMESVDPKTGKMLWDASKGYRFTRRSILDGVDAGRMKSSMRKLHEAWPNGVNTLYAAITNMYDRAGRKSGKPVWDVANARPTEYGKVRRGMSLRIK